MKPSKEPDRSRRGSNGVVKLIAAVTAIACVWCVVLPWYASQPKMKKHLQFLDDRGIDPSAMFYTELDAMDAILDKLENPTEKKLRIHDSKSK